MQIAITLVAPDGGTVPEPAIAAALTAARARTTPVWLAENTACDLLADVPPNPPLAAIRQRVAQSLARFSVDWAVQPGDGRRKRVFVSDMDSTIIGQECIDEIADVAGVGDEVAAITARAMAGEIDFEGALTRRVALLAGLGEEVLARVMAERITVNAGAATLIATMRARGAHTLLVSGGFTHCASHIACEVGFDAFQANRLLVDAGRLTGRIAQPILGREAKLAALRAACDQAGVGLSDAVSLGDGANDFALIEHAGLGVAYRAKPILAARADARIDHADLTAVLYFQGYRRAEFVTA